LFGVAANQSIDCDTIIPFTTCVGQPSNHLSGVGNVNLILPVAIRRIFLEIFHSIFTSPFTIIVVGTERSEPLNVFHHGMI